MTDVKRTPEQFLSKYNSEKIFMEFRLWAIFSNFGQNMKGQKITIDAEISTDRKKHFFLPDHIKYMFSISEFLFHLSC